MSQRLSAAAFGLCNTEDFQRWIDRQRGLLDKTTTVDKAADYVRDQCGITSRSELDRNAIAAAKFVAMQSRYRQAIAQDDIAPLKSEVVGL